MDESDRPSTSTPPPFSTLTGIRFSRTITETDNAGCTLSHQTSDDGDQNRSVHR
ncbi:hypothetical protein ACNKHN_16995 [Shigella flexneri]